MLECEKTGFRPVFLFLISSISDTNPVNTVEEIA